MVPVVLPPRVLFKHTNDDDEHCAALALPPTSFSFPAKFIGTFFVSEFVSRCGGGGGWVCWQPTLN
jgi:hypothetical protein